MDLNDHNSKSLPIKNNNIQLDLTMNSSDLCQLKNSRNSINHCEKLFYSENQILNQQNTNTTVSNGDNTKNDNEKSDNCLNHNSSYISVNQFNNYQVNFIIIYIIIRILDVIFH